MWERRYAFPKPSRDENGERQYAAAEVAKLRAIKRLMDVGMRPGKIILCTQQELDALAEARIAPARTRSSRPRSSATCAASEPPSTVRSSCQIPARTSQPSSVRPERRHERREARA